MPTAKRDGRGGAGSMARDKDAEEGGKEEGDDAEEGEEDDVVDDATEKEAELEAVHHEEQLVEDIAVQLSREQAALKRKLDRREKQISDRSQRQMAAGTAEERERLNKELAKLHQEKARLKGALECKSSEAERIRGELEELRRRKKQLETDIATERKAARAFKLEKDKEVNTLAREIQQKDMQINKLKAAGERKEHNLRRQLESAQAKADRLEKEKMVRGTPRVQGAVTRATARVQQRQLEKCAVASKMLEKEVKCGKTQRAIEDLVRDREEVTAAIREIEERDLPAFLDKPDEYRETIATACARWLIERIWVGRQS